MALLFHLLVQDVKLLCRRILLQELAGHLSLCCQHDSIFCENPDCGACMGDGLKGILDLIQPSFWREDSRLRSC